MAAIHQAVSVPEFWLGYVDYFLGVVAYERNRLEEAADHFRKLEPLRYRMLGRDYHDSLLGLSMIALAQGDLKSAEQYAAKARTFAHEIRDPKSTRHSNSHEARLALAAGKLPRGAPPSPLSADSMTHRLEVPTLTYAELQLHQPPQQEGAHVAISYIEEALEQARRTSQHSPGDPAVNPPGHGPLGSGRSQGGTEACWSRRYVKPSRRG